MYDLVDLRQMLKEQRREQLRMNIIIGAMLTLGMIGWALFLGGILGWL